MDDQPVSRGGQRPKAGQVRVREWAPTGDRAAVFVRWLSGFALATALVLAGEIVLVVIFSLVLYRGYSSLYLDLEQYPFQLLWGVFLAAVVGATSMLLRRQDIAYAYQDDEEYHEEPLVEEVS